jgi:drug/metabolite transporter (DMT)-like permease
MKRVPPTLDPLTAMGWQLLLGSIPLAAGAAALEHMPAPAAILNMGPILLLLAVIGTALPFAIWFSVLRSQPLRKANSYTFLTSIFGLAIGAAFFRERLGWLQIAGVALTLLGVHLAQRSASDSPTAPSG